jgi:hypothetical protein
MPEAQRLMLKQKYGWLYEALVKLLADEDPTLRDANHVEVPPEYAD